MIDSIVKMIIQSKRLNGLEEENKKYKERLDAYNAWIDKHRIKEVKAGERIDVRDTEYVWCVG